VTAVAAVYCSGGCLRRCCWAVLAAEFSEPIGAVWIDELKRSAR
jgi:hypothetical protein